MIKRPLRMWLVTYIGMLVIFILFLLFAASENNSFKELLETGTGGGSKIGLIRIEGIILDSEETIRQLRAFVEDSSIEAIILRINSPGGAVVPSQDIYDELMNIREKGETRLIVSMGTVAASGGYYIAAAADKIYASKGTLTGSIGVIMEIPTMEVLMNKIGVESVVIKSGAYKEMGSLFKKIGEKEVTLLQNVMNDIYEQFIEAVAEGRNMDIDEVRKLAEGKVYSGRQALKIGLIDEIGSMERVVEETGILLGIEGKPKVIEKKKKTRLFDLIESKIDSLNPFALIPGKQLSVNYLFSTGSVTK